MDLPLRIALYDRTFSRVGILADPAAVDLHVRHNAVSTGTLTVHNRHRHLGKLLTDGCRVTVDYAGDQVFSGLVNAKNGKLAPAGQLFTFEVLDDFEFLTGTLAWPDPTKATAPGVQFTMTPAYYKLTGPAETVVKTIAAANAARLGGRLTVAPDQGRGDTITVRFRMHKLADRLFPKVTDAGIGVQIRQVGQGLVLDCYTPGTYPVLLTPQSGVVSSAEVSIAAPEVTRTVAGGQDAVEGDPTTRAFVTYVAGPTEDQWGIVREAFVDARDVDTTDELNERAQEAQAEGRRKTGFRIELQESRSLKYGKHLTRGDTVTEALLPDGETRTHTVTEGHFTWKSGGGSDGGFRITPVVGEITNSHSRRLAVTIARQAERLRNLETR